jgi:hypothetical protein
VQQQVQVQVQRVQRFQRISGRKRTMQEPAEQLQARYVSFYGFLGKLS